MAPHLEGIDSIDRLDSIDVKRTGKHETLCLVLLGTIWHPFFLAVLICSPLSFDHPEEEPRDDALEEGTKESEAMS